MAPAIWSWPSTTGLHSRCRSKQDASGAGIASAAGDPRIELAGAREDANQVRHAIELAHAQVVVRFGDMPILWPAEDQQAVSACHERAHLLAGELATTGAALDSLLPRAGSCFAAQVGDPAVAPAAVAPDVLSRVVLVTEDATPPVDQPLPDGGVIRSRCAQMTAIPAVTDLLRHVGSLCRGNLHPRPGAPSFAFRYRPMRPAASRIASHA